MKYLSVLFITFVYSSNSYATEPLFQELSPNQLIINADSKIVESSTGTHVLKLENGGSLPETWYYKRHNTDVLDFKTFLHPELTKVRSEIRVRGADIKFTDASDDKTYYTYFEFYTPTAYDQLPKTDWNIIWQCAQIGADTNHFVRNGSPPLSLQMMNQRLYLKTFHDYRLRFKGDSSSSGYSEWSRDNEVAQNINPVRLQKWAGYIRKNAWNKVFMAFKMGKNGRVRIWMNGKQTVDLRQPIGYQTADDPFEKNPVANQSMMHIKKRCSSRFGLYQGYGTSGEKGSYRSRILFKAFRIGTSWNDVKWGRD